MTIPDIGIRELVYLGGYQFSCPPSVCDEGEPWLIELAQRRADGSLRTDHNMIFSGVCDRPTKQPVVIGWTDASALDQAMARKFLASSQEMDHTRWVEICEQFFFLEGEPYSGLLQRRDAVTETPGAYLPLDVTPYAPRLEIDGTAAALTLGSPDVTYRTPWSASGVAPSGGSQAVIWYTPLWRVKVVKGRILPGQLRTAVEFTLEEV
jgi:hypothetical protein